MDRIKQHSLSLSPSPSICISFIPSFLLSLSCLFHSHHFCSLTTLSSISPVMCLLHGLLLSFLIIFFFSSILFIFFSNLSHLFFLFVQFLCPFPSSLSLCSLITSPSFSHLLFLNFSFSLSSHLISLFLSPLLPLSLRLCQRDKEGPSSVLPSPSLSVCGGNSS